MDTKVKENIILAEAILNLTHSSDLRKIYKEFHKNATSANFNTLDRELSVFTKFVGVKKTKPTKKDGMTVLGNERGVFSVENTGMKDLPKEATIVKPYSADDTGMDDLKSFLKNLDSTQFRTRAKNLNKGVKNKNLKNIITEVYGIITKHYPDLEKNGKPMYAVVKDFFCEDEEEFDSSRYDEGMYDLFGGHPIAIHVQDMNHHINGQGGILDMVNMYNTTNNSLEKYGHAVKIIHAFDKASVSGYHTARPLWMV